MSAGPDESLLDAVGAIAPTSWSGQVFRFTTARRDPLSGEGARLFGGRWNPPGLFPTIYLAVPLAACLRELAKHADDNHLTVAEQLQVPHKLHTITVTDLPVLDLRDPDARDTLGLDTDDLTGPWGNCQPIGHAAWFLEYAGVFVPSATGDGHTLALFEHLTQPGQVRVDSSEPLTNEMYVRHHF